MCVVGNLRLLSRGLVQLLEKLLFETVPGGVAESAGQIVDGFNDGEMRK